MVCEVNGQIVDCGFFWHNYGWLFAIIFFLLGLLFTIKTDWIVRAQIWSNKLIGVNIKPNKRFYKFIRIIGVVCLIITLFSLYKIFF